MANLEALIRRLPKAELHVHIEGTLEPELMFELARRNGVALELKSVEEVKRAYAFHNLQSFLDIYYEAASVLRTEADFFELTWAYLARVAKENVKHAEIFFDPQTHTERGVAFEAVVSGICRALHKAESELDLTSGLILCFLRHLSEEAAMKTLDEALPFKQHLLGVGLDSSEVGHPPGKFQRVYEHARAQGLLPVAHAGEEGPPAYIREALDLLKARRIDHGVRCLEDPQLVKRLAADKIPLTVCPLSNVKLRVVQRLEDHPLRKLLDAGLVVTINSDDPSYLGGYLTDNYLGVQRALGLDEATIRRLARHSFEASFLDETRKKAMIDAIDAA